MSRVLVLGAGGMLGGMVAHVLGSDEAMEVVATTRHGDGGTVAFDAQRDPVADLLESTGCEWIVNAIGLLDSRIDEADPASVASATQINGTFPHRLVAAAGSDRRVIQIGTDGVFAGSHPWSDEDAAHDAGGVYAHTKTLGEVRAPNVVTLRCSIIGPEPPPARSLLGWALSQANGATILGYDNQWWNGITTYHFAKLCAAVIRSDIDGLPALLHVVPADSLTKFELLREILGASGRHDVTVVPAPSPTPMDRRLSTRYPDANRRLWAAAGYLRAPSIGAMLGELAAVSS